MKTRLYLAGMIALLAISIGWVGCGTKSNPTSPTAVGVPPAPSPTVRAVTVTGNGSLTAAGQTSQMSAEATFSDGSKKDITATAQWNSSNRSVVTVSSSGLVTAMDFGKTDIYAYPPLLTNGPTSNHLTVTVLPEGTYILSGQVTEAGNFPVSDVRIELIGGPMNGQAVMTDQSGRYAFNGVAGVQQVRATKAGYVTATQSVSQDTEHVDVALTPSVPYPALDGVYRLTFTAAPSCHLPDDAVSRAYTAAITQTGPGLTIKLTDAQFWNSGSLTWNTFYGRISGNTVTFTLLDTYYGVYFGGGVVEKLAESRYLSLAGTAVAPLTGSPMSAAFAGTALVSASPYGSSSIAMCTASDHQLVFTQTASTTSRKRS